jgi:hypothetical protein
MTIEEEVQKIFREALPGAVKSLGEIAADPNASATNRLHAIGLLLHFAVGPGDRPAHPLEIVAAHDARAVLSNAVPFLEQAAKSHKSARIRLRAAKLANLIGKLER